MSHQRGASIVDQVKEPHSVSLKVLRLSRPSLSTQHPLPLSTPNGSATPSPTASLAYPSTTPSSFILSPLLTLPPAFGSAYVGETFACTLCANNEILPGATAPRVITNVRIEAEMKIPSSSAPMPLVLGPEPAVDNEGKGEDVEGDAGGETIAEIPSGVDLGPGQSLQKVVNFALKEEGSHVLAVTVTYSETGATSGRVRTFRKLYQFVCKACMVVRTKTGVLPTSKGGGRRWALEAQLENCGEEIITLDMVNLETRDGFRGRGVNWEVVLDGGSVERPVVGPGECWQVAFVVEEVEGKGKEGEEGEKVVFGVLSLGWRGKMGNRGFLSTGNLGARLK